YTPHRYADPTDLTSCPTRRTSDLGAGDEHGPRILCRGQRLEEFHLLGEYLFAETPETADDAVQGFLGAFAAGAHLDRDGVVLVRDRKSTRLNSSHVKISYAVFCLK